jgi:hypothetical protein
MRSSSLANLASWRFIFPGLETSATCPIVTA